MVVGTWSAVGENLFFYLWKFSPPEFWAFWL
jgi:hypothetical protein